MKAKPNISAADEAMVVEYLRDNSNFFAQYPELLTEMQLPHQSGKAVSLVERQISVLRSRSTEMRKQLKRLLDTASENSLLYQKICDMTLALMDARSLSEIDLVLAEKLGIQFNAEHVTCFICVSSEYRPDNTHIKFVSRLPETGLTNSRKISCGALREAEFSRLFPETTTSSGSVVIIPLRINQHMHTANQHLHGLLVIGSKDSKRFSSNLGTVFLQLLGDVLARVLEPFLEK